MKNPLRDRRAGVLLHPTSLPGTHGSGNIGQDARRFIDFLQSAGITVWQMLPLGPTHADLSPYQCLSVHAGNTGLICLEDLVESGWLPRGLATSEPVQDCLVKARAGFDATATPDQLKDYADFKNTHAFWLNAYALYQAIRQSQDTRPWYEWPAKLRNFRQAARVEAGYAAAAEQARFEQYLFFSQWAELHRYSNDHGIALFGDMPIYVAHDSADVWANPELFTVNEAGESETVSGVPPDYFSETGQRWGNPLYRWDIMEQQGFGWWVDRFRTQLELFDLMRLDHFRGFEKFWEIPAGCDTAIEGHWVDGPGGRLFDRLGEEFGELPVVAEDLGIITPEVDALRMAYGFPGMKILQFAFDGSADNPYLPQNHENLSVVYTGTHDNDTTLGWYDGLDETMRARLQDHAGEYPGEMPWPLIEMALGSEATLAILPMQDILSLGSDNRMNTPGTTDSNWQWRFNWAQVTADLVARIRELVERYKRNNPLS